MSDVITWKRFLHYWLFFVIWLYFLRFFILLWYIYMWRVKKNKYLVSTVDTADSLARWCQHTNLQCWVCGHKFLAVYRSTHCGLATPCGGRDPGQHWFRYWFVAWQHQAITWTDVDLSSPRSRDVDLRAISLEISHHHQGPVISIWGQFRLR